MSMVAAVKGYRMLVVMPDGMSTERLAISRAFGAQVMTVGVVPDGLGRRHRLRGRASGPCRVCGPALVTKARDALVRRCHLRTSETAYPRLRGGAGRE
jgi:hypothetical protein